MNLKISRKKNVGYSNYYILLELIVFLMKLKTYYFIRKKMECLGKHDQFLFWDICNIFEIGTRQNSFHKLTLILSTTLSNVIAIISGIIYNITFCWYHAQTLLYVTSKKVCLLVLQCIKSILLENSIIQVYFWESCMDSLILNSKDSMDKISLKSRYTNIHVCRIGKPINIILISWTS